VIGRVRAPGDDLRRRLRARLSRELRGDLLGPADETAFILQRVGIGLAVLWLLLAIRGYVVNGADTFTYYSVGLDDPYVGAAPGIGGAYLYSPAFAQVMAVLRVVPWPVFNLAWQTALLAGVLWMAGPLAILFTGWTIAELVTGNIQILLGVAIVLGIRRPAAWAFVLLTKVTPAVGLLYFVGRRDWRSLGIALGFTALIVAVSFALAPGLWADWVSLLLANSGTTHGGTMPGPLPVRLALAGIVALYAGYRSWPWVVPIACCITLPIPWWTGVLIAAGAVRLWLEEAGPRLPAWRPASRLREVRLARIRRRTRPPEAAGAAGPVMAVIGDDHDD
jgi:hypothetical protein